MVKTVDLLDSFNQKFDPGATGMTSSNAEDGIKEAYEKPVSFSNVSFTDWVGFAVQGSTAAVDAGNTDVDFSTSNEHILTGTATTTLNVFTFPKANAKYFLIIPSTVTISAIDPTNKREFGSNPFTPGKEQIMTIHWDGIIARWQTSEEA